MERNDQKIVQLDDASTPSLSIAESTERIQRLEQYLADAYFITDAVSGEKLYASPAYEQIWQRTCASLYANPQSWIDSIHPDDRPHVGADLEITIASPYSACEFRILRPDGSVRWVRVRSFPVMDPDGKVVRVVSIAHDITDSKSRDAHPS